MSHHHAIESWEDDDSFALPSNDFNPIRISSASSYSSAGVAGGDEDEDDDWGVDEDFGGRVGASSFKLGVPSGSGGGGGLGGWGDAAAVERDGFDEMDDEDEDDRTDTLKAGQTTIRLPSSFLRQSSSTSSSDTPTLSTPKTMTGTVRRLANQSSISSFVIPPDVDIEDGFSLPTSLSNLNLRPLRSQSSRASFSSTTSASNSTSTPGSSFTWGDTPSSSSSTNSAGGAAAATGGSFSRKSNGLNHPRLSAPSPSSRVGNILHIPFSPPSLVRSSSEAGDHPSESSSLDFAADASEDVDDLDGIVLPDPLFFSRTNDLRLQALLDAKGKGNNPPASHHFSSNAANSSSRSNKKNGGGGADNVRIVSAGGATDEDMSFEAGLVIDDDVPITMGRLGRVRSKARNKTLPLPKRDVGGKGRVVGGKNAGGTVPSGRASGKEDWEKDLERERGWGRTKSPNPPPVSVRETFRQPEDHQHPSPPPSSSRPTPATSTRPRAPQSRSATAGSLAHTSNPLNSSPPGSSLRAAKSNARINLGHGSASSSSLHPSSAAPPSPSPHQQPHYPGSHAASLLSRKSSLPMLFANEQERSSTPSSVAGSSSGGGGGGSRFAAPTAASIARQRDRIGGPDLFNPPNSTSPPTSSRPSTPSSPFPLSPSMATVQPFHQRLTMPTSSSRQKTRSAITPNLFSAGSHPTVTTTVPTPSRRATTIPKPELVSMPKKKRQYGDGTELDGFEDLKVDREKEGRYRVGNVPTTTSTPTRRETKPLPSSSATSPPANPPSRQGFLRSKLTQVTSSLTAATTSTDLKRKKPTATEKSSSKTGPPRTIKLIRYMGEPSSKVRGQMRYNPKTLRWEGNESALQAFEGLSSSARPLLIAHHTGKSTTSLSSFTTSHTYTHTDLHSIALTNNNLNPSHSSLNTHLPGSPVSSAAISLTAKVVGNMWFDPERMKWIHMGGRGEEEEEDVFAGMDDEDEVELALKGPSATSGSVAEREEKRSSSRARRIRESGASSNSGMDLDEFLASEGEEDEGDGDRRRKEKEKEFARRCRLAEEGHRAEVAGWGLGVKVTREREEGRLWEIRRVAMRTGKEGSSRSLNQ
ncbi:hypothetical protein BDY24DRAFT_389927 [Mrakia frigida]|uniref:uncharacterized protein n=1 Tax=Mrakia frigida TaxID=29902 RepID=UPI003FCC1B8C